MGKWSKGFGIGIAVVLFCWLLVSGIFYYHHQVTEKAMKISGFSLEPLKSPVIIKEIKLVNKESRFEAGKAFEQSSLKGAIINSKYLSFDAKLFLMRLMDFYSLSYTGDDGWYLEVSGAYLQPDKVKLGDSPEFKLSIDGEYASSNGYGEWGSAISNLRFFTIRAKKVNPDLKTVKVQWNLYGSKGRRVYIPTFKNNSYSFFEAKPEYFRDINPADAVIKAFYSYYEKKKTEVSAALKPGLTDNLKWSREHRQRTGNKNISVFNPNIRFVGNYKGFKGVIAVELNYIFNTQGTGDIDEDKVDCSQVYYVTENHGKWRIIDIGSLKKL